MRVTRRFAGVTAALVVVAGIGAVVALGAASHRGAARHTSDTTLPVKRMEAILQASGTVDNGVLSVEYERTDIPDVHIGGVPILPQFEINGTITFQPLGDGSAFMNGDVALKPDELDPFITGLLDHGLTFQAEHQHMYDFEPMVWFVHFRGKGSPTELARKIHEVVQNKTATPLPQPPPSTKTPLDPNRLMSILHGYSAEVSDGVVTVFVARKDDVMIGGVHVEPQANISTAVAFEPLNDDGSRAAVIPDFAMVTSEIDPVVSLMRQQDWDIGCLYNQETGEHPQLYFSHQFKTGDPYELAHEVRAGLNRTNSQ